LPNIVHGKFPPFARKRSFYPMAAASSVTFANADRDLDQSAFDRLLAQRLRRSESITAAANAAFGYVAYDDSAGGRDD